MEKFQFSSDTQKTLRMMLRPLSKLPECHYNRDFLESYIPNETFYLDQETRKNLAIFSRSHFIGGDYLRDFILDLSWNSSRLEGNGYSYLEAKELIRNGVHAEHREDEDAIMILNHQNAIQYLVDSVKKKKWMSSEFLFQIHYFLSKDLLSSNSHCGKLRTKPVKISSSNYTPPVIPFVIQECFTQIVDLASRIEDPFEHAFFLMVHLPYLQAFIDVNKRTSRVALNAPLVAENLCPFTFVGIEERDYIQSTLAVYQFNEIGLLKELFVWGYKKSCMSLGRGWDAMIPHPIFVQYRTLIKDTVRQIVINRLKNEAMTKFLDEQKKQLPPDEQTEFGAYIEREIRYLTSENTILYKLSQEEFDAWKEL